MPRTFAVLETIWAHAWRPGRAQLASVAASAHSWPSLASSVSFTRCPSRMAAEATAPKIVALVGAITTGPAPALLPGARVRVLPSARFCTLCASSAGALLVTEANRPVTVAASTMRKDVAL